MAKYIYTHGKRRGKVYQEFYYTLNGEQIVNKKTFYCPVNTKWLSRVEFRDYILQVIRDYYPNYLIVNELPEQLEPHIIYFLEHVNEDQSVYYDVYVYFEKEQKQIVFKGANPTDLTEIKEITDNIKTKSLKNIYNQILPANKNIITDNNGFLTTANIPHLYMHYVYFRKGGTGEVSFIIYNTSSVPFTGNSVGFYLYDLGLTEYNKVYPAIGRTPGANIIGGIYGYYEQDGMLITVGFRTVAYRGIARYENDFSDFNEFNEDRVTMIF